MTVGRVGQKDEVGQHPDSFLRVVRGMLKGKRRTDNYAYATPPPAEMIAQSHPDLLTSSAPAATALFPVGGALRLLCPTPQSGSRSDDPNQPEAGPPSKS